MGKDSYIYSTLIDTLFHSACVLLLSALQVAFGSLYRDDVLIKPSRVIAILAAACMLQLVSMHIKERITAVSLLQNTYSKNKN